MWATRVIKVYIYGTGWIFIDNITCIPCVHPLAPLLPLLYRGVVLLGGIAGF